MPDECSIIQSPGCNGISYPDNCTIFFYKTVLTCKRLLFQNYILDKIKILFKICRMYHFCIKICSVIQQFILLDPKHCTQITADIIQVYRRCQYILMKTTYLMVKYFLHVIQCVIHTISFYRVSSSANGIINQSMLYYN